jgi:hypothetical protein
MAVFDSRTLIAERDALRAELDACREALADRAYTQGQDSDGWFRECNICGEECRLPDRDKLVHSITCVLSRAAAAVRGKE